MIEKLLCSLRSQGASICSFAPWARKDLGGPAFGKVVDNKRPAFDFCIVTEFRKSRKSSRKIVNPALMGTLEFIYHFIVKAIEIYFNGEG